MWQRSKSRGQVLRGPVVEGPSGKRADQEAKRQHSNLETG